MSSSQDVRCSKFAHISKWEPVNGESTISCDIYNSSVLFPISCTAFQFNQSPGKKQLKSPQLTQWRFGFHCSIREIHFSFEGSDGCPPLPVIIIIVIWKHSLFPFLQAGRGFWSFQKLDWQNNSSRDYVTIATIVFFVLFLDIFTG